MNQIHLKLTKKMNQIHQAGCKTEAAARRLSFFYSNQKETTMGMRRTIIDGKMYLKTGVVPTYRFKEGSYSETQIVAEPTGEKKREYIEFTHCCLVKVSEGDIIVNASLANNIIKVCITKIAEPEPTMVHDTATWVGTVLFEGTLEQYERKRSLQQYENAISFAVGNLYSITGGFYVE